MNWNVMIQALDTAAFVLVTPEIIGETRLKAVQGFLQRDRTILAVGFGVFFGLSPFIIIVIMVGPYRFKAPSHYMSAYSIRSILVLLFIVSTFSYSVYVIMRDVISTAEFLAVRGRLFILGAVFFFCSRGISIWLALHPATGAHGG